MIYEKEQVIMERKKALKLTHRDLANALQMPPSTIANKLAGFIPLTLTERNKLNSFLTEKENERK